MGLPSESRSFPDMRSFAPDTRIFAPDTRSFAPVTQKLCPQNPEALPPNPEALPPEPRHPPTNNLPPATLRGVIWADQGGLIYMPTVGPGLPPVCKEKNGAMKSQWLFPVTPLWPHQGTHPLQIWTSKAHKCGKSFRNTHTDCILSKSQPFHLQPKPKIKGQ